MCNQSPPQLIVSVTDALWCRTRKEKQGYMAELVFVVNGLSGAAVDDGVK
jgi:hypothetical protein